MTLLLRHCHYLHFLPLFSASSSFFLLKKKKKNKMSEIAVNSFISCHGMKWRRKINRTHEWRQCLEISRKASQRLIKNHMEVKPSSYSAKISTDIPLYESPGALFDEYLEDMPRVFKAIFPDNERSRQLNKEEWRIRMLPIDFLFLTVRPVVDVRLRCKTSGSDYPPEVPSDIRKILVLDITRWELQGLNNLFSPSHFSLSVKGALYSVKRERRSRLNGQLLMSMSLILPPALALIPEDVRRSVAESALTRLVENMKNKVNSSLLADYSKFKKEKFKQMAL